MASNLFLNYINAPFGCLGPYDGNYSLLPLHAQQFKIKIFPNPWLNSRSTSCCMIGHLCHIACSRGWLWLTTCCKGQWRSMSKIKRLQAESSLNGFKTCSWEVPFQGPKVYRWKMGGPLNWGRWVEWNEGNIFQEMAKFYTYIQAMEVSFRFPLKFLLHIAWVMQCIYMCIQYQHEYMLTNDACIHMSLDAVLNAITNDNLHRSHHVTTSKSRQ